MQKCYAIEAFFISWMDLIRTRYTDLGVSLERFAFIGKLTCATGNGWCGMFLFVSHSPAMYCWSFHYFYICAVYFSSVLVAWQYISH